MIAVELMLPRTTQTLGRTALVARRATGRRTTDVAVVSQRRFAGQQSSTQKLPPNESDEYWTMPYIRSRLIGEKSEGWEAITAVTIITATLILTFGVGMGPETDLVEWAKDEALARDIREYNGLSLEYGKIYHQSTLEEELRDDDDDDDDDDDED